MVGNVTLEPMLFLKMMAEGNFRVLGDNLEIDRVCRINLNYSHEDCMIMDDGNHSEIQVYNLYLSNPLWRCKVSLNFSIYVIGSSSDLSKHLQLLSKFDGQHFTPDNNSFCGVHERSIWKKITHGRSLGGFCGLVFSVRLDSDKSFLASGSPLRWYVRCRHHRELGCFQHGCIQLLGWYNTDWVTNQKNGLAGRSLVFRWTDWNLDGRMALPNFRLHRCLFYFCSVMVHLPPLSYFCCSRKLDWTKT